MIIFRRRCRFDAGVASFFHHCTNFSHLFERENGAMVQKRRDFIVRSKYQIFFSMYMSIVNIITIKPHRQKHSTFFEVLFSAKLSIHKYVIIINFFK